MRRSAPASVLVLLLAAACSSGRAPAGGPAPEPQSAGLDIEVGQARAVVNAFLSLEARGLTAADTLLLPGADFIMTGTRVTAKPRLAGYNGPGDASVEDASAGLAGVIAWVIVGYRFTGRTADLSERARATFILEKQRAGWRIRHVHSSMVERW